MEPVMFDLVSNAVIALSALLLLAPGASAQLLQGHVEQADAKLKEHCVCINPNKVKAVEVKGEWQLVDEDALLLSVPTADAANQAIKMIKFYGMTELCTVGSSDGKNKNEMVYFKAREEAPVGSMSDEDAIGFDTTSVKAEKRDGRWKVISKGDVWLLDFDQDREAAEQAAEVIRHYGFNKQCFVGNPARQIQYWHK
jgi:hypothetical protein